MTLTKEQAEKLVDRLADKSLTFGCLIKIAITKKEKHHRLDKKKDGLINATFIGEAKTTRCVRVFTEGLITKNVHKNWVFPVGHPILIGDVLKKMSPSKNLYENPEMARFLVLWENCGFTKSLQEILETIEWECKCPLRHVDHDKKCFPWIAKPSPATDLFEFLVSLFTT